MAGAFSSAFSSAFDLGAAAYTLTVQNANVLVTSDNVVLSQHHVLTVQDAAIKVESQNVVLSTVAASLTVMVQQSMLLAS